MESFRRLVLVCVLYGLAAPPVGGAVAQEQPVSAGTQASSRPDSGQAPAPSASPQAGPQQTPAQTTPGQSSGIQSNSQQVTPVPQVPESAAPLRVMVGKSILINTTDRLRRVSVTDPTIADALVVTPTQILVHGKSPGEVSLLLWDVNERSHSFDLRVDVDVTAAKEEMKRIFPDEQINVSASRSAVVVSGQVSTKEVAEHAGAIAGAFSKNVVNVLSFGPVGAQEVLLEVKFAEVDRTALTQLGANLLSTGAGRTIGTTTTQQFGGFGPQVIDDAFPVKGPSPSVESFTNHQTINDVLNLFLFRPDIHLGLVIKALQQKNVLQILAEPNLIAVNGKEASFLAGGEFPFPVIQPGGGGFTSVTIQFKEFGVRLNFTPVIMPNGNIHLQVKPEVSALDFTNALTISGFLIPALSTRRASTELEIQDGQSFVIAGLLDNRLTNVASKIPGLGNVPVLGNLFKSKNLQKSRSELMVLVTARRVSPSAQPTPLPKDPKEFMNPQKFDSSKPSGGAK